MTENSSSLGLTTRFLLISILISGLSFIWTLTLSERFGLTEEKATNIVPNYIFNADSMLWINRVSDPEWHENSVSHPLRVYTWYPLARAISTVSGRDGLTTAVYLNAFCVASAIFFLSMMASKFISSLSLVPFAAITLLGSSFAILAAVDHFSFSFMLMSAMLLIVSKTYSSYRFLLLCLLGLLLAGTTVTNSVFVILTLTIYAKWYRFINLQLLKKNITSLALVTAVLLVVGYFAFEESIVRLINGESKILKYFHFWIISDPLRALFSFLIMPVLPLVAPTASITNGIISLEPLVPNALYNVFYSIAVISSWYLLTIAIKAVFAHRENRPELLVSALWLLFNAIFHNFWGDELLLFTPHFMAALFTLLALGTTTVKTSWPIVIAIVLIFIQQLFFWHELAKII